MMMIRGGEDEPEGERVPMRGDNASIVQWGLNCEGVKDDIGLEA